MKLLVDIGDFEHILARNFGAKIFCLLDTNMQQLGPGMNAADKGIIFNMGAIEGRVFRPTQDQYAGFFSCGMNGRLKACRSGTYNNHIIQLFCHMLLLR